MSSFLQALGFLTRIPLTGKYLPNQVLSGSNVAWFGVAGGVIGVVLIMAVWILEGILDTPPGVAASILVGLWALVTGALHLDGLGDCGDAWMGGHDRDRILEIMKDTTCGTGAVVAVVVILGIKIIALWMLLANGDLLSLLFAAVIARIGLSLAIIKFPYIRDDGLGSPLQQGLQLRSCIYLNGLLLVVLAVISPPGLVLSVIGGAAGFACIYFWMVRKVGGFTGDIYGALVEAGEAAVLIALATRI